MSALLAIAGRELRDRMAILPLALVLGLAPFLAPWFGIEAGPDTPLGQSLVGVVFASLGLITAILAGVSVIGGDLAEGRLAFFFARPVAWWSIWGGKLLAALLLTLGAGTFAALPFLAAQHGLVSALRGLGDGGGTAFAVATAVGLVALAHVAGVAYRARTPWLVLDLVGLAALFYIAKRTGQAVYLSGAMPPTDGWSAAASVGGLSVPLLVASAAETAVGRVDLRRSHAALSITLWSLMLSLALGGRAWVLRQLDAGPADLAQVARAYSAPTGPWVVVTGPARGPLRYWPEFLLDTRSGTARRVGAAFGAGLVSFSADGRRAAWIDCRWPYSSGSASAELVVAGLDAGDLEDRRIGLSDPQFWMTEMAPDGRRVAIAGSGEIRVLDVASGRTLLSASLPQRTWATTRFLPDGRLRVYATDYARDWRENRALRILEAQAGRGTLEETARVAAGHSHRLAFSPDGDQMLMVDAMAQAAWSTALRDARSGAEIATLLPRRSGPEPDAAFLGDGRIVLLATTARTTTLRLFSSAGLEERAIAIDLDWRRRARLAGEPAPGLLTIGVGSDPGDVESLLVDLGTGAVRRLEGLRPLGATAQPGRGRPPCAPGSDGCRLFVDASSRLVSVDPLSGERHPVPLDR
jgi:hypothetical protein